MGPAEVTDLGVPGVGPGVQVGAGGFGRVYRAEQLGFGRFVAVKVLNAVVDKDAEFRRFERERQALGAVSDHPNIVSVFGWGLTEEHRPYMIMEYLPAGTLAELIKKGPLPLPVAVSVTVKLSRALSLAHSRGVLHRDLKPENVLISSFGEPVLCDFGIARPAEGATTHTSSVTTSVLHAAPEVLEGAPPTEAIDIWALLSTLHTMLSGRPPFRGSSEHETMAAVITRVLTQPPTDLRPTGVPDDVAATIEAGLAKDPSQRPATAAMVADRLEAVMAAHGWSHQLLPVPASAPVPPPPVATPAPFAPPPLPLPAPAPPPAPAAAPAPAPAPIPAPTPMPTATPQPGFDTSRANTVVLRPGDTGPPAPPPSSPPAAAPAPAPAPRGQRPFLLAAAGALVTLAVIAVVGAGVLIGQRSSTPRTTVPSTPTTPTTAPAGGTVAPTTAVVPSVPPRIVSAQASCTAPDNQDAANNRVSYQPGNAIDGDPGTTWRCPGDATGQSLTVRLAAPAAVARVGLVPGYDKVDPFNGVDRFFENRRVSQVSWQCLRADNGVAADMVQSFGDDRRMQRASAPATFTGCAAVQVNILGTRPSGGRDFTPISEIVVEG